MEDSNIVSFPQGAPSIILGILSWVLIGIIANFVYKKTPGEISKRKAFLILFVGLFSFTINIPFIGTTLKFSVLPLGVWLLFFIFRSKRLKGRWQYYRSFAWIGFWSNYIFLLFAFLVVPIHHFFYPKDDLTTYIAYIDKAVIIETHPLAKQVTIDQDRFNEKIKQAKRVKVSSMAWYEESRTFPSMGEKFPYQLAHTNAKRGSGINPLIFIEKNGKGLLITTTKEQLYFQTKESLIQWEKAGGK